MRLVHADRDDGRSDRRDPGHHTERRDQPKEVRDDAGQQRARDESGIAPEPIDTDSRRSPRRMGVAGGLRRRDGCLRCG